MKKTVLRLRTVEYTDYVALEELKQTKPFLKGILEGWVR